MHILQALNEARITFHVAVADRDAALSLLAKAFASGKAVVTDQRILGALSERERLSSTNLGCGVALPHARVPGLGEPQVAIAVSREALDYDQGEGAPVHVLVGLLSDLDQPRSHLSMLAALARLVEQPAVRERLAASRCPQDVIDALTEGAPLAEHIAAA